MKVLILLFALLGCSTDREFSIQNYRDGFHHGCVHAVNQTMDFSHSEFVKMYDHMDNYKRCKAPF